LQEETPLLLDFLVCQFLSHEVLLGEPTELVSVGE
jgi:hypothetical protein